MDTNNQQPAEKSSEEPKYMTEQQVVSTPFYFRWLYSVSCTGSSITSTVKLTFIKVVRAQLTDY